MFEFKFHSKLKQISQNCICNLKIMEADNKIINKKELEDKYKNIITKLIAQGINAGFLYTCT